MMIEFVLGFGEGERERGGGRVDVSLEGWQGVFVVGGKVS